MLSLKFFSLLRINIVLNLLNAQERAFIYEFARMIFAYINDKNIEVSYYLLVLPRSIKKQSRGMYPQPQDAEKFWNNLQYKLTLSAH